ncbi:MAG: hypothetical protein SNI18_06100, partial [Rikenellaceae bacterium]
KYSGSILKFNSEKYRSKSAFKNMTIIVLHYLVVPTTYFCKSKNGWLVVEKYFREKLELPYSFSFFKFVTIGAIKPL